MQVQHRRHQLFGESTVPERAERLPFGTHIPPAGPAHRTTFATTKEGLDNHPLSYPMPIRRRADRDDPAEHLVPHDHRRIDLILVAHDMHVGTAHSGVDHLDPRLPGAGSRHGHLAQRHILRPGSELDQRPHPRIPAPTTSRSGSSRLALMACSSWAPRAPSITR